MKRLQGQNVSSEKNDADYKSQTWPCHCSPLLSQIIVVLLIKKMVLDWRQKFSSQLWLTLCVILLNLLVSSHSSSTFGAPSLFIWEVSQDGTCVQWVRSLDFPWDTQVYSHINIFNHGLKVLFKPYVEVHLFQNCQQIQAFNYKQKDA